MTQELEHLQAAQFYGKGVAHMFPGDAPTTPTPWPRAGRYKDIKDYDESIVHEMLRKPAQLQDIDPRNLHATQPSITRSGVDYYARKPRTPGEKSRRGAWRGPDTMPEYHATGKTYEQQKGGAPNIGNEFPVVYRREAHERAYSNEPQNLLLSGHHRAAAALAEGRPLRARIVEGPWGGPRRPT